MTSWPTRFLTPVGKRAYLRIFWGDDCPNSYGRGTIGTHNAQAHLMDSPNVDDHELGGCSAEYDESRWPTACDHCAAPAPAVTVTQPCCTDPACAATRPVVYRHVFRLTLYQTADATHRVRTAFETGDMYYATWFDCESRGGNCHHGWVNCDGKHLMVVLPNGREWDVDSRASNCTLKDDNTHRCWVRTGNPETEAVHVTKGPVGHVSTTTCSAGAGSIQAGDFHGFLHHGRITL